MVTATTTVVIWLPVGLGIQWRLTLATFGLEGRNN